MRRSPILTAMTSTACNCRTQTGHGWKQATLTTVLGREKLSGAAADGNKCWFIPLISIACCMFSVSTVEIG